MAHFRATIQGTRGEASRLGTKKSGIDTDTNGWNNGVHIYGQHVEGTIIKGNTDHDDFHIFMTNGSNVVSNSVKIGIVSYNNGTSVFIPDDDLVKHIQKYGNAMFPILNK